MRPCRAGEVEDKVDPAPASAIPLLVSDVFEPVEVLPPSEVEQHVDATVPPECQLDERLAVRGIIETARLFGDHRSARAANRFDGGFRGFDRHVATDDRRSFASER